MINLNNLFSKHCTSILTWTNPRQSFLGNYDYTSHLIYDNSSVSVRFTGMDKTSLDTSSRTLFVRDSLTPEGGCPRHVGRNYVPVLVVAQSNVELRNYVPLLGMTQSNVDLRNHVITSDCYLNIVVSLDCY